MKVLGSNTSLGETQAKSMLECLQSTLNGNYNDPVEIGHRIKIEQFQRALISFLRIENSTWFFIKQAAREVEPSRAPQPEGSPRPEQVPSEGGEQEPVARVGRATAVLPRVSSHRLST